MMRFGEEREKCGEEREVCAGARAGDRGQRCRIRKSFIHSI